MNLYYCRGAGFKSTHCALLGCDQCDYCEWYQQGHGEPHFNLPAIPIKVGYMPWSWHQDYPSSYWYIASRHMLWTCFRRWGLIVERV